MTEATIPVCPNCGGAYRIYARLDARWSEALQAWELLEHASDSPLDCTECDAEFYCAAPGFPAPDFAAILSRQSADLATIRKAAAKMATEPATLAYRGWFETVAVIAGGGIGKPSDQPPGESALSTRGDDATILAALRMWQASGEAERAPFMDIATDGGELKRLSASAVDSLVRRFGGAA